MHKGCKFPTLFPAVISERIRRRVPEIKQWSSRQAAVFKATSECFHGGCTD